MLQSSLPLKNSWVLSCFPITRLPISTAFPGSPGSPTLQWKQKHLPSSPPPPWPGLPTSASPDIIQWLKRDQGSVLNVHSTKRTGDQNRSKVQRCPKVAVLFHSDLTAVQKHDSTEGCANGQVTRVKQSQAGAGMDASTICSKLRACVQMAAGLYTPQKLPEIIKAKPSGMLETEADTEDKYPFSHGLWIQSSSAQLG